jgi:hypothetical protein
MFVDAELFLGAEFDRASETRSPSWFAKGFRNGSSYSGNGSLILDFVSIRRVLLLCPGGLEHGGGIGRQMGYFLSALPQGAKTPTYHVIDTRGPWFLGGARWRVPCPPSTLWFQPCGSRGWGSPADPA